MSTCSFDKLPTEIMELIICDSSFNMKNLKDFVNVCEKWKCIVANFISRKALDVRTPISSVYFISMFPKPIYNRHNFIYRFVDLTLIHSSAIVNWVNSIHDSSLDYINNCISLCNFTMLKFDRKFVRNSFRSCDSSLPRENEVGFTWNVCSTSDTNLQNVRPGISLQIHTGDQNLLNDTLFSNLSKMNLSIDFSDLEARYSKQKLNSLPDNFTEKWELYFVNDSPKFLIASIIDSDLNVIFEQEFCYNRFSSNKFKIKLLFLTNGNCSTFVEIFPDFFTWEFVLRDRVNIDKFIRHDVIKRLSPPLVIILKLRSIRSLVKNRKAKNILRLKLDRCFKSITKHEDLEEFSSDEVDADEGSDSNNDSFHTDTENYGDTEDNSVTDDNSDTENDTEDDNDDDNDDDSEDGSVNDDEDEEYDQDIVWGMSSTSYRRGSEDIDEAPETKFISSARKLRNFFYVNDPTSLSTDVCLHFLNGHYFSRNFQHSFHRDLKIRLIFPLDGPLKLGTDLTIIRSTKMSTLTKLNSCEFISRVIYSKTFDSFYFSKMKAYFDFCYK